jgi:hypothetical protein
MAATQIREGFSAAKPKVLRCCQESAWWIQHHLRGWWRLRQGWRHQFQWRRHVPKEGSPSAVGLLAPSQRYSTIKEEEACRLWPEKKEAVTIREVKVGVVVLPKRKLWDLKKVYKWSIAECAIRYCSVLWQLQDYDLKIRSWLSLLC